MKKIYAIIAVLAVAGGIYTCTSMTHVGQGEVGVVWTARSGVRDEVLQPGLHFVHPLAKVKDFPVSQQQLVLSNNPGDYNQDNHADWHVDAPADGGMVKLNVTVNYNFLPDRVTNLYAKFNVVLCQDFGHIKSLFFEKSAKCTNQSHLFHGSLDNEPLKA